MPVDPKGYIQLTIGLTAPNLGEAVPSNLSFVAGSSLAAASLPKGGSVTVCGAASAGLGLATKVKLAAVKQKLTHGLFVHV
jgi:hypothetical protein